MSEPSPKKIFENCDAKEDSDIFYHITNMRVPLYEVDLGQALYHGNYYHLFELGREDMLRKSGFPYREFLNRQLHLTITNAHCKYRKSLQYDDQIELRTAIISLGKRGLSFSQLIYRPLEASQGELSEDPARELCTQCRLDMICVHFTGRPTLLPKEFVQAAKSIMTVNKG